MSRRVRRELFGAPRTLLGGLTDLNSAPQHEIARLPGLDDERARMIVLLRGHLDGFTSLEQLQGMLDLPEDVVADLRDCAVLLPR